MTLRSLRTCEGRRSQIHMCSSHTSIPSSVCGNSSSVPRQGYLIVAVPRLRFGYRIELRAYSVSVALRYLPIHTYVAPFDCNGVNGELFQNMKHVSGPNHVRHFQ